MKLAWTPHSSLAQMALLKSKGAVKLVEEDGQFKAQVETDMGPMPLAGYVKDWSGSDEGKI